MKWLAIKILEHRVKQVQKKIDKFELENNSIFARAFGDAKKSYTNSIMFLKSEIESKK